MTAAADSHGPRRCLYPCGRPLLDLPRPLPLVVLGATGSIGRQTLDLVRRHPERLRVAAVACHASVDAPGRGTGAAGGGLPGPPGAPGGGRRSGGPGAGRPRTGPGRPPAGGRAARGCWRRSPPRPRRACLVNGLVGAVGLEPTLAAAGPGHAHRPGQQGIAGGGRRAGGRGPCARAAPRCCRWTRSTRPSPSACPGASEDEIARLILTASGGPFRTTPAAELADVTLEQVLDHPTWNMGPKITVDSATLMNKGLEVIEAHHLFGVPYDRIDVVVHPGSIVHSLVEFVDGALLAQLGTPGHAHPPAVRHRPGSSHWPLATGRLDLLQVGPAALRGAGPGALPLPAPGPRGGRGRRVGADRAERGQRGGRGGPAGRAPSVTRTLPRIIADTLAAAAIVPVADLADGPGRGRRRPGRGPAARARCGRDGPPARRTARRPCDESTAAHDPPGLPR